MPKSYYAEKDGHRPEEYRIVSAYMPCTAKKFEIGSDDQDAAACRMWILPLPPESWQD
ncbi:MAG: hypothetical protein ACLTT1_16160 [[Clostridium] scindens]